MMNLQFTPFNPPLFLRGKHTQTIYAALTRPRRPVLLRRTRLGTADNDFIDIDYADVDRFRLSDDAPLVLLLHGLEGSASSTYAKNLYHLFAKEGLRAVGMNYRSCSGEMNFRPKMYHAGATDDVLFAHEYLRTKHGNIPFGMIGISLGANMLLKYLGENDGERSQFVDAAVALSPFFDMTKSSAAFNHGAGRLYSKMILRALLQKLADKRRLQGEIDGIKRDVDAIKTIHDFDEYVTAPLGGFKDANDYFRQSSSGQFLPTIETKTLLIRACDDPFFDAEDIPRQTIADNPNLVPLFPKHGGHVGFVDSYGGNFWAGDQAAAFLAAHLKSTH